MDACRVKKTLFILKLKWQQGCMKFWRTVCTVPAICSFFLECHLEFRRLKKTTWQITAKRHKSDQCQNEVICSCRAFYFNYSLRGNFFSVFEPVWLFRRKRQPQCSARHPSTILPCSRAAAGVSLIANMHNHWESMQTPHRQVQGPRTSPGHSLCKEFVN